MAYTRPVRDLAKIEAAVLQPFSDKLQRIHAEILRQNPAVCKRQDLSADERQNLGVDYRGTLATNLRAMLEGNGLSRDTLEAFYLDGPKKGDKVSSRTIGSILNGEDSSPSLDVIAAVAAAFDLEAWQLLVPDLDPRQPPVLRLSDNERKARDEYERIRKLFLGKHQK